VRSYLWATGGQVIEVACPARDLRATGARPMIPVLTLTVLIVAFGAEVGWLCRC
jgi:hypothetical protein